MSEGQKMNVVPVSVQKKTKINYFTASRTINSDYKKIKKEVFLFAAETMAIFYFSQSNNLISLASCNHSVEKHPSSIFTQKKTPEAKTTFVF